MVSELITKHASIDEFRKSHSSSSSQLILADSYELLKTLPSDPLFDLIVTSPPYNIGKEYEKKMSISEYCNWQRKIITESVKRLKPTGSICWQVGNHVDNGRIVPLDIALAPIFNDLELQLRNRIIWAFGHGLHSKRRFSGRYEVVMWYTKSDSYTFNLDDVRIPALYPGKKHYKGPKAGEYSGNPLGKNPDDVWFIPNVKSNHIEKTSHPCQFPVALIERIVLALTNPGDLVFDPFCGVASSGVAAILHGREFWGCDIVPEYIDQGYDRLLQTLAGTVRHRAMNKPIYSPKSSSLSRVPDEWKRK